MEFLIFFSDHKFLTGTLILIGMVTIGYLRGSLKPKGEEEE